MDQRTQQTTDADRIRWLYDRRMRLDEERREFVESMRQRLLGQEREPKFYNAFSQRQVNHLRTVYRDLKRADRGDRAVERADDMNNRLLDDLLDCTILNDWEVEFVDSLDKQRRADPDRRLSAKQEECVRRIHKNRVILGEDGRE